MQDYSNILKKLKEEKNHRTLPNKSTEQLLDLCSNDYMGLNENAKMQEHFWNDFITKESLGACSSRLLGKNLEQHTLLEAEISLAFNSEACLLFNTGYHANLGILPTLATNKDLILSDKLIHASLIDAAKLSNADFKRYKHLDYSSLEKILLKERSNYDQVFIVSESIFSMDGDIADLNKLIELKQIYNCLLYIDEAHALGVRGKKGLGCAEEQNCIKDIDFIVGTMGKSFASIGAFVVCNQLFKDYLINFSRTFIYSTALPPLNIAWSRYVFQNLQRMDTEREYLKQLSNQFARMLNIKNKSHIIPFIIGSNSNTIKKSELLRQHGYNTLPIRFPTVQKNTARLRFSLNVNMNIEQLKPIKKILEEVNL